MKLTETESRMVATKTGRRGQEAAAVQKASSLSSARWIKFMDLLYNLVPTVNNTAVYT